MSVNDREHTRTMFQAELEDAATIIAELEDAATIISALRDPHQAVVGHGAFLFENKLGGRIAVVPWNAGTSKVPMMDVRRACQLKRIITWLAHDKETGSVDGIAWLFPQFLKDSENWRSAVWNAGPDEATSFRIHLPDGMPPIQEAWHLTPNGERLAVKIKADTLTLDRPLYQWELVVMK